MNESGITIVIAFLMSDILSLIRMKSLFFHFKCVFVFVYLYNFEVGHESMKKEQMRPTFTIFGSVDSLKIYTSLGMEFLMSKHDITMEKVYHADSDFSFMHKQKASRA